MRRVMLGIGVWLVAQLACAQTVYRCEGKDGRVTYSDEACPAGSRSMRKLQEAPTVSTATGKDTPRDAREAGQIAHSRAPARSDPLEENRRLDEQIAATRRECTELARRVQYARQDLDAAAPAARSAAELALRRAQDQYQLYCPRR